MDRGTWWTTVHGVQRVRYDLVISMHTHSNMDMETQESLITLLGIINQRFLVLGLNLGHLESKMFMLFSIQYHTPREWFSFLELHPIGIWHSLGSQRTVKSRKVRHAWGRAGRGAKLIPETPGGNAGASPSSGSEDKRGTSGNRSPKSGLGAGPTHLVCSLTSDTEKAAVIWLQV